MPKLVCMLRQTFVFCALCLGVGLCISGAVCIAMLQVDACTSAARFLLIRYLCGLVRILLRVCLYFLLGTHCVLKKSYFFTVLHRYVLYR